MRTRIDITEYDYSSHKVPAEFDGFKILVLSDLHCNRIGKHNNILINEIDKINPDIIVCAGDMVSDNARHMKVTLKLMRRLAKKYHIYYACGNHELRLFINPITNRMYRRYCMRLKKMGIALINNKSVSIVKNGEKIRLTGLGISRQYYNKIWNRINMPVGYIDMLAGKSSADILEILVAHNPDYFDSYAEWGADIVLSGHVHGGIMVLPYVGGVIAPSLRLFPKYDFGRFEKKGSVMYLSRGLGSHTIPIRIFNNPEIMSITLRRKQNGNTGKA